MIKYTLLLFFSAWGYFLSAQECPTNDNTSPCCNGAPISTDPRNGGTQNSERPNIIHKFNWMTQTGWDAYYPNAFGLLGSNVNYKVANPFFSATDLYLRHINLVNYGIGQPPPIEKLDFHPEDGWELFHRQNGLELDEVTRVPMGLPQNTRSFPYYILYNKYRGQVRFVGASPRTGSDAQQAVIKMGFVPPQQGQSNNISALFSGGMNKAQTLDKPSQNRTISMATDYPTAPGLFVADFTVGYDPCACGRKPDDILFEFATLQSADVQMSGRLVGTNVPLNGSGQSPLLNRKDYLLAVNTAGFDVNGGAQTYKNIDALVEKYKQPTVDPFEKAIMDGLKSGVNAGATAGFGALSGAISTGLRNFYCTRAYSNINDLKPFGLVDNNGNPKGFLKDGKLSAGTLAAGADFISGLLFDKPEAVPNITFIEAELALKGKVITNTAFLANNIRLAHPGSKAAQENILWQNYPFYNEALGVVSFLKQPKAKEALGQYDVYQSPYNFTRVNRYSIKLSENIEYYFNPTLDIDLEKTKVFAAFLFDVDDFAVATGQSEPFKYENKIGAFNRVVDASSTNLVSYITDLYPLECFQDLSGSFDSYGQYRAFPYPKNQRLRIFMDIHYKSNTYGKKNRQNFVYTFPLDVKRSSEYSIDEYRSIQNNSKLDQFQAIELIKDRTFTDNTEIRAWQYIGLAGNIQVSPGKTLKLIAPQIDISPGTQLPPNVEIIAGNPIGCLAPARPVSAGRMKQFCTSSEYKSNNAAPFIIRKEKKDATEDVKSITTSLSVSPNPFNNQLSIQYELQEPTQVTVSLSNALGQTVKVLVNEKVEAGSYQINESTADLPSGVYIITMKTPTGMKTQKVVKQNN